jgi:hypothetical protein
MVLDPFSGTGTACFVARDNHRQFVGFDLYWQDDDLPRIGSDGLTSCQSVGSSCDQNESLK